MWFSNINNQNWFIVVLADDTFSIDSEKELSDRIDMADTGSMDEVVGIYKVYNTQFYEVKVGNSYPINTDEEYPFRCAAAPLYITKAGGDREEVGTVTFTDH